MPKIKGNHLKEIADYENCKTAIKDALKDKCKKNSRGKNVNRRRLKCKRALVKKIKMHLPRRAWRLKTVLENGTYNPPKMHEFNTFDGTKHKPRHITVPDLSSQFVHHAVFNVIGRIIENRNYYYDCGNMPRKGQTLAIKEVKRLFKNKKNKYYWQFDIRHYYDTIPHKHLIWALRRHVTKDKAVLKLLWKIIKSSGKNGVGIAIGFYSSQYLAVFYLQGLDYKIKQEFARGCGYVRYVDDGVIVSTNRRKLKAAAKCVAEYVKTLGLELKGNWAVREIDKRLMLFIGFRFGRGYTMLGKSNMYRIARAARHAAGRKPTPHRAAQLLSYWGTLKQCDSYNFRQARFDNFVNIRICKEVISNANKKQQPAA